MTANKSPEWHHLNTRHIIEELLADGSDPDALYIIEHHCCGSNFLALEKFCVEAFKLGYEIEDPEEFVTEQGTLAFSCDIISETPLKDDLINQQITQLIELSNKYTIFYDGWGTYFESDDAELQSTEETTTTELNDTPLIH